MSSTSIILGTIANVMWLFVLIPQLLTNYKLKKTDGISLSLIISWIYGDILVIVSSYLKQSNKIVMYSSIYHILLIMVLGCQVLYYRINNNSNNYEQTEGEQTEGEQTEGEGGHEQVCGYLTKSEQIYILLSVGSLGTSVPGILFYPDLMADIFGWCALGMFVSSRIPQIILNYERGSSAGISSTSFILINISNYISLSSILVDVHNYDDVLKNLQWIISPFITSILDIIMLNVSVKPKIEVHEDMLFEV
jgi:uncharacterized protein with PQ loop repeat